MAVIGPLRLRPSVRYDARYMEATFRPGLGTAAPIHSGPEAWYVIGGAQWLQVADRTFIVRAGDSAPVRQGPATMLGSLGDETRRSVLLVLHDSAKRRTMAQSGGWQSATACQPRQAPTTLRIRFPDWDSH
jgi:quercetin dioxygenase-like cupin family protein